MKGALITSLINVNVKLKGQFIGWLNDKGMTDDILRE